MKKVLLFIVCLMTFVVNVDAQWYRAGSRAGNRMADFAHSMKMFYIGQEINRIKYGHNCENIDISHYEKTIFGGFGLGKSYCDEEFDSSFDIDLTIMNVFLCCKVGDKKNEYDYKVPISLQLGYMLNVLSFGGKDLGGRKHCVKMYISPLIGVGYTEFGGALMMKYQCVYALGKVTDKGLGFSIGLAY